MEINRRAIQKRFASPSAVDKFERIFLVSRLWHHYFSLNIAFSDFRFAVLRLLDTRRCD